MGVSGKEIVDKEFVRYGGIMIEGEDKNGRVVKKNIRGGRFEYKKLNNIEIRRYDNVMIDGVKIVSKRVVNEKDGKEIYISGYENYGEKCNEVVIEKCKVVKDESSGVSEKSVKRIKIKGKKVM